MSEVPPTALEARQLVKQYPGVLAVDGVSFCVQEGSCFGLLGPNGAGKTTTVEIIEGVTRPTSGEVFYYGEIAGSRFRQETGIQFQNTALQYYITVRETLQMFRALYDKPADLDHVFEALGCDEERVGPGALEEGVRRCGGPVDEEVDRVGEFGRAFEDRLALVGGRRELRRLNPLAVPREEIGEGPAGIDAKPDHDTVSREVRLASAAATFSSVIGYGNGCTQGKRP